MKDDVALVILQAKAAISKACEGRACLPECLRAIERAASVETAAAPLFASGAKAAKRTPAGDAPPHGARLRVPVGAVRPAWRAFASFSRRARGLFRRIWRGLAARLPAGARLARNAIAAVAITLGVTFPSLRADVTCIWQDGRYVCSGQGQTILVASGGGAGGGDVIVTNIVGTCTNCVAMSPEYVHNWKTSAHNLISENVQDLLSISNLAESVRAYLEEVSGYTSTLSPYAGQDYYPANVTRVQVMSNFLHSVGAFPFTSPQNKAASFMRDNYSFTGYGSQRILNMTSFYDGAAGAFNEVAYLSVSEMENAAEILEFSSRVNDRLSVLDGTLSALSEEQCTAQWDGGSGGGVSGGGSTIVTNQLSGNWCTYDQGEAIKVLLSDIKKLEKEQITYLISVSNYLSGIDASIRSALFSRYTNIPTESNMGETWQDVYLAGQPTQWGYEPTNILQRIELLIYGMSGVGTNSADVAEATGVDPDDVDTAGDDAKNAIDDLSVGDSAASADVRSIMDALTSFFRTFNGLTGDRFSGQTAMGSYSVEIGEQRYDVPALVVDSDSSNIANVVQSACRAFLTCAYLLFAVFSGWRFYALFLGAVVKYAKWAQELLSSLFAD